MSDYETAQRYWSQQTAKSPELFGVAALGGCGLTEVIYRHHEEVRHFTQIVALKKTMALLELGCGNGRWVTALAPRLGRYEAVDFSPQMLAVARRRVEAAGLRNVTFIEAAAQGYAPTAEQSFDVIYLSGVTQYLHDEDLAIVLRRLLPRLTPTGVFVERSTVHRRVRTMATQADYFSIYRTAEGLVEIFADAGLVNRHRAKSYAFLNFSWPVRRVLGTRPVAVLAAATAPASFAMLRTIARLRDSCFAPTGELIDYSHEFFLFQRPATT